MVAKNDRYLNKLETIKPGDKVVRLLSSALIPMIMRVLKVTDDRIICRADEHCPNVPDILREAMTSADGSDLSVCWQFNKQTGGEIDEDLGWTGEPGSSTGSFLAFFPEVDLGDSV